MLWWDNGGILRQDHVNLQGEALLVPKHSLYVYVPSQLFSHQALGMLARIFKKEKKRRDKL